MKPAPDKSSNKALRLAVILPRPGDQPNWVVRLLDAAACDPRIDLGAVIEPTESLRNTPLPGMLQRLWCWAERKVTTEPEPLEKCDLSSIDNRLALDDAQGIAALQSDVILDLSGGFGTALTPELARQGIWFMDFDTGPAARLGARAVVSGDGCNRLGMFCRTATTPRPRCLATARLVAKPGAVRNAYFQREKSVALILRELRLDADGKQHSHASEIEFAAPVAASSTDLVGYILALAASCCLRLEELVAGALRLRPGMFFLKSALAQPMSFRPTEASSQIPADNTFFADPFLWDRDGQSYCFFEVFDYASNRGHIGVGRFAGDQLVEVHEALRTDYHLSFPYLFEADGTLYMIPETSAVSRIEVWRCTAFPDRWERHAVALEGTIAADSTLNLINGQWWLFTNISTDAFAEANSELHIYLADGPDLKELIPHSYNPVVMDSRTARSGGRVLEIDGTHYRPSQDNSHGRYGFGLNLMRIDQLSLDDYSETKVWGLEPGFEAGINGCHHLDMRGGRVVIDVRKRRGGWAHNRTAKPVPAQSTATRAQASINKPGMVVP